MQFVTADEASLEAFLSVSAASPFQAQLRDYADSLLQQRYTKSEWWLLGLENDTPVARAAVWGPPDHDAPTDVVLIAADWHDLAAGRAWVKTRSWRRSRPPTRDA